MWTKSERSDVLCMTAYWICLSSGNFHPLFSCLISQILTNFVAFLSQGICKQRVVHQNTLTARSTANGQGRFRASELCPISEAFQWPCKPARFTEFEHCCNFCEVLGLLKNLSSQRYHKLFCNISTPSKSFSFRSGRGKPNPSLKVFM